MYVDLARELKKLWNMKVRMIPIVNGALGTATKELAQGLKYLEMRGRVETIQTTALLRFLRITGDLRRRAITQTSVKIYQLALVWKTLKREYTA